MASHAKPRPLPEPRGEVPDYTDFVAKLTPDQAAARVSAPDLSATAPPQPAPPPPAMLADYRPVPVRARHDGWTAARQRKFLTILAETGSISQACRDAGVASRSAYRLRQRPDAAAFATAWDQALRLATLRLTTLAFERAVKGSTRDIWRDGELVGQVRSPSDKILMFLLGNLLPRASGGDSRLDQHDRAVDALRAGFPATLAALTDSDMEMVPIEHREFYPDPPGDEEEDV